VRALGTRTGGRQALAVSRGDRPGIRQGFLPTVGSGVLAAAGTSARARAAECNSTIRPDQNLRYY